MTELEGLKAFAYMDDLVLVEKNLELHNIALKEVHQNSLIVLSFIVQMPFARGRKISREICCKKQYLVPPDCIFFRLCSKSKSFIIHTKSVPTFGLYVSFGVIHEKK
jgi:hypothetical protein